MGRRSRDSGRVHGLVRVHKPSGPTSHTVMREVQTALGASRSGHAGTLDPLASGLLVVLLGEATKLSRWVMGCDKAYVARVALGTETDTLDAAGEITATHPVPSDALDPELVNRALMGFLGTREQVPPVYSAVKTDGRTLMARVRSGETPDVTPRVVRCDSLELIEVGPDELTLRVRCGSGYYVRSLARDLAVALGTVGHLAGLVREEVGAWRLDDAVAPDALSLEHVVPLAESLPSVQRVELDEIQVENARHGRPLSIELNGEVAMAIDGQGSPVAMLTREDGKSWSVARGFRPSGPAGFGSRNDG